jgi:putative flippase GtrA
MNKVGKFIVERKDLGIRGIKFTIRGVAGSAVDMIVLGLLSTHVFKSYFTQYILTPTISFEVATLCNYIICYFWIWNHRVNHNARDFFRRIPTYHVGVLLAYGIKMGTILIANQIFHFSIIICNLIAILVSLISGTINFFAQEKLTFKHKPLELPHPPKE